MKIKLKIIFPSYVSEKKFKTEFMNYLNKKGLIKLFDKYNFHLGKPSVERHQSITQYIEGSRRGYDYFKFELQIACLKRALRVLHTFVNSNKKNNIKPSILFVVPENQQSRLFLQKLIKHPHGYIKGRWPKGLLRQWYIHVKKPVNHYLRAPEYEVGKRIKNRFHKTFQGIAHINERPDLVVFLCTKNQNAALKECKQRGIPTIAVVNRNDNANDVTYVIPINNTNSVITRFMFTALISTVSQNKLLCILIHINLKI